MSSTDISPFVGLIGAVIGFCLAEGSRYFTRRMEISQNREILRTELESVLAQLPQKRDILLQAINHMEGERFMPTSGVRMMISGYAAIILPLYPHLKPLERNCLHVIYERLRFADEFLDKLEDSFAKSIKDEVFPKPFIVYRDRLRELLNSYDVVEKLVRSYLSGHPLDVFAWE
jgi:hypothetical protein